MVQAQYQEKGKDGYLLFLAVLPEHKWQINGQMLYNIRVTHGHTHRDKHTETNTHKHIQYNHTGDNNIKKIKNKNHELSCRRMEEVLRKGLVLVDQSFYLAHTHTHTYIH